ncbi:MAG: molybdopterin-dependent oxidoreductase [Pseudomonadota bacterium]
MRAAIASTCPYCGVGCGVIVETEGGAIAAVRGDPAHPANFGRLCSKGVALAASAAPEKRGLRLLAPEIGGAPVSWEHALDHLAARFAECIAAHGPDSVGFYLSGQLLTEDYYVFNKLARALVGTNNVDSNSRLCMSSAVAGYKRTLGADAPPACYEDLEHARCLFIAGSNAAWAHPVLFRRIEAARARNPALKVIVVDPRRTETARFADLHLAIVPGSDVALFNAMLHVILWEGLADSAFIAAHTSGFEAVRDAVREYTPRAAAAACGIGEDEVIAAARLFARAGPTLSLYCQGLNQSASGTDKNVALINLHLATGQIGRPGAGPFSLTGQPNAMGGREVGAMANLLPGHRDAADPAHRAEVARLWGVDRLPARPGRTAVEMFEAARAGEIRMLWIACTNPAQSLPSQRLVREAFERAELVVVQEAYRTTETARLADVLLPAATWGEKDGTVTNSERRISRVRAAVPAPGLARPDWEIARDFGRRLEARLRPGKPTLFPWRSAEEVFDEHRESTRGRDLDITGLSWALLDSRGPQQWPYPEGAGTGRERLYEDAVFATADGRARFVVAHWRAPAERPDAHYPIRLTTVRLRDQWHAMSRTGSVPALFAHAPEPRLAMHPSDLERAGLQPGALARVSSRRGSLHVLVEASEDLRPGIACLPMHWGSRYLGGAAAFGANSVTLAALDPHSRQPELKHCAVRVERAELGWRLVAFGSAPDADGDALFERLDFAMRAFAFVQRVPAGERGVLLRLADEHPPSAEVLERLDRAFGLAGPDTLRFDDPRRAIGRRIALEADAIRAVRLSGDTRSEHWLRETWLRGAPVGALRRYLAMPVAVPPGLDRVPSRTVCVCLGVDERAIAAALGQGARTLRALQAELKCGTNCGSCLPELRALLAAARAAA